MDKTFGWGGGGDPTGCSVGPVGCNISLVGCNTGPAGYMLDGTVRYMAQIVRGGSFLL